MVLAQKQKYTPMEQDRKPGDKPMHLWVYLINPQRRVDKGVKNIQWGKDGLFNKCCFNKAKIYNGAKMASSISGAGKTEQLPVKKLN